MRKVFMQAALVLIGAVIFSSHCAGEIVERIAAVVGDRVILSSELANQVQTVMFQMGAQENMDSEQIAKDMLNNIVNDAVIISAAREDTTITATPEEIKFELDEHIATLISRFPSEEAFIEQLSREGLTKRTLEKKLRPEIRDQILKRKIIGQKLSSITLSRQEVEEFYERYHDSLPEISPSMRLAHILLKFKLSAETDDSLKAKAEEARQLIVGGLDFSAAADSIAAKSPGAVGGRIGFIRRNDVVPEFGRAAFSLQPGNVSGPVRTEYGWHIIKNHDRRADSVDVSHLLLPAAPSVADSAKIFGLADSLYNEIKNGGNFKEIAKLHSEDDATRATGGEMESMTLDQLRPEFIAPLDGIEINKTTTPIISQLGYHILKLLERNPGRKADLTNDYDAVRNIAQQEKTATMVEVWVEELKKNIYVDIRDYSIQ